MCKNLSRHVRPPGLRFRVSGDEVLSVDCARVDVSEAAITGRQSE